MGVVDILSFLQECRTRQNSIEMSLSDEERDIVVRIEIEKARRAYEEALVLLEKEFWSGAAGRLYYAIFHAVSGLLISDKHQVNSHKGSHILFSNYYIKPGALPNSFGTLYSQLESMREESEYNCTYDVDPDDLKQRIAPAKQMIDTIEQLIKSSQR